MDLDADPAGEVAGTPDKITLTWTGQVTFQETSALREELLAALAANPDASLWLDVRGVTQIDRSGIAVLVGVQHRTATLGRLFVLVDTRGVVSEALSRMHLIRSFLVTETVHALGNRDVDLRRREQRARAARPGADTSET